MPRVLHEGRVLLVPDRQAVVLTSGVDSVHHELTVPRPVPVCAEVESVPLEVADRADVRVLRSSPFPELLLLFAKVSDSYTRLHEVDVLSPAVGRIATVEASEEFSCILVPRCDVVILISVFKISFLEQVRLAGV